MILSRTCRQLSWTTYLRTRKEQSPREKTFFLHQPAEIVAFREGEKAGYRSRRGRERATAEDAKGQKGLLFHLHSDSQASYRERGEWQAVGEVFYRSSSRAFGSKRPLSNWQQLWLARAYTCESGPRMPPQWIEVHKKPAASINIRKPPPPRPLISAISTNRPRGIHTIRAYAFCTEPGASVAYM